MKPFDIIKKTLVGIKTQVFFNSYTVKYPKSLATYRTDHYSFTPQMQFDSTTNVKRMLQEKINVEIVDVYLTNEECNQCSTNYEQLFVKVKSIEDDREISDIKLDLYNTTFKF